MSPAAFRHIVSGECLGGTMKSIGTLAFGVWLASVGTAWAASPQSAAPKDLSPSFASALDWGQLPDGRSWGQTSAVEVDRDGVHIWALDRCGANSCAKSMLDPILEFDAAGKTIKHFGAGLMIQPHGIHADKDGNVWVTDAQVDAATHRGAQVYKFSPDGKLLLSLGKAGVSAEGPDTFSAPNDVVVAPNGNIFVADGHVGCKCPNRIVKFSPDGMFIKQWGRTGTAMGEIDDPHALAMDSQGRLFVGDRQNARIQIFDQDGKFITAWTQFGRPSGMAIDKNDVLYVTDPESTDQEGNGHNPGFKRGVWVGSAKTGEVTGFIPDPPLETEGIAADAAGNIYAANVRTKPQGVHKYAKH